MIVTPKLLEALNAARESVEGLHSLTIAPAVSGVSVKGKRQDCDYPVLGEFEWVDQSQYAEDSFCGTVSWRIDDHWLIASFST